MFKHRITIRNMSVIKLKSLKCSICSEEFRPVYLHKIYVRLYLPIINTNITKEKKEKTRYRHRYIPIGSICLKCIKIDLIDVKQELFSTILQKVKERDQVSESEDQEKKTEEQGEKSEDQETDS